MSIQDAAIGEIRYERARQDAKFGVQSNPDGTGPQYAIDADVFRQYCQGAFARGEGTWFDVLLEEVYEAGAESDPVKLKTELIQVAAVALAWVEHIVRRDV